MLYIYNMRLIFAALYPTMLVIAERVPVSRSNQSGFFYARISR